MEKTKFFFAVLAGAAFVSCSLNVIKGNGVAASIEKQIAPFYAIESTGSVLIRVHKGAENKIILNTDANLQEYVDLSVKNNVLYTGSKWQFNKNIQFTIFTVDVWTNELNGIFIKGSSNVEILDNVFAGKTLNIDVLGSGNVIADAFPVETARVKITGAGTARVWAENNLSIETLGQGNVICKGNPEITEKTRGGGKTIRGSGVTELVEQTLPEFTGIESMLDGVTVRVHKSAENKITLNCDANLKEYLDIIVRKNMLRIGTKGLFGKKLEFTECVLDVYTPNIFVFLMDGSGGIEVIDNVFDRMQEVRVVLSGAGTFDANNFPVSMANLDISGSGRARVWCKDNLVVHISGAGEVVYRGNPQLTEKISGKGKVTREI
ncbi:MAG: DUF2807 domain-containing protein [Spirochaetaceae bacterium]|nr:DUF2807 domain-containing protein [Spirochaetaceae bacterium]